jgi:hypothetical protein
MGNTEKVHQWFRGASEVTKRLRRGSTACELGAAGISLWTVLAKPVDAAAWLPFGILGLTFLGTFLRAYSGVANGFAQRCRRISLRAFCVSREVDDLTVATLDDDAPPFVESLASQLPAKTMEQYYEPTAPPGPARQAELYAHSAFYTWRLLRIQAVFLLVVGVLVFAASGVVVYCLAASPDTKTDRRAVLEAVCTVVLLVVAVKACEASWEAFAASSSIRAIENDLLEKPKGEALKDLIDSYDIERAAGPSPSTFFYNRCRNTLAKKWEDRRKTIVDQTP